MANIKKWIVSVISIVLITALMSGGTMTSTNLFQAANAEKSKLYCGPELEGGGRICDEATNQVAKEFCESNDRKCKNTKQVCQEDNQGAKCEKFD